MPGSESSIPEPSRQRALPHEHVYVFTRDAVRQLDYAAVEEFAIPSIVLMENAARHTADVALDGLEDSDRPRVVVVAGTGNNGGDGLAAARHLHNAGLHVCVFIAGNPDHYKGDARTNFDIACRMGLETYLMDPRHPDRSLAVAAAALKPTDLIIDALVGTGLSRDLDPTYQSLVTEINGHAADGVPVLAVDLPSGMDADTGLPRGGCIRASVTVTFAGLKEGFLTLEAQPFLGEVVVADIGVPTALLARLGRRLITPAPPEERAPFNPPSSPRRRGPRDT